MPVKLDLVLADMERVARAAGELTLGYFRRFQDLEVMAKGQADFVSEADRQSELLIRRLLAERYPDFGFVGEEFAPTVGRDSEYSWLVDPIDGTSNFINGMHYTISIALRRGERTVCGALYNPVADEMFTAFTGGGAWLGGQRLEMREGGEVGRMAIGTGLPNRQNYSTFPGFYRRLETIADNVGAVRVVGSSANSCAYVACGRLSGYFEEAGLIDWAVGVLLVEEAGGIVTDWRGRGARFYERSGRVIVANRAAHAYLLKQLQDAPESD